MDVKIIFSLIVCLAINVSVMANTIGTSVERELGEFRVALQLYRAATKTERFRDFDHVKQALLEQMEFRREKLSPNREILDPWRRPYVFSKSVDGSLVILSLGNPEVVSAKLYLLVVQGP